MATRIHPLGLAAALRAKIPAERIVNFMSIQQIKRWIARLRERSR
jgi:ribosomal protein L29